MKYSISDYRSGTLVSEMSGKEIRFHSQSGAFLALSDPYGEPVISGRTLAQIQAKLRLRGAPVNVLNLFNHVATFSDRTSPFETVHIVGATANEIQTAEGRRRPLSHWQATYYRPNPEVEATLTSIAQRYANARREIEATAKAEWATAVAQLERITSAEIHDELKKASNPGAEA